MSVPDDVFRDAEALSRRTKRSRSEIYSRAVADDRVTEALDRTVGEVGEAVDPFVRASAGRVLMRSEW